MFNKRKQKRKGGILVSNEMKDKDITESSINEIPIDNIKIDLITSEEKKERITNISSVNIKKHSKFKQSRMRLNPKNTKLNSYYQGSESYSKSEIDNLINQNTIENIRVQSELMEEFPQNTEIEDQIITIDLENEDISEKDFYKSLELGAKNGMEEDLDENMEIREEDEEALRAWESSVVHRGTGKEVNIHQEDNQLTIFDEEMENLSMLERKLKDIKDSWTLTKNLIFEDINNSIVDQMHIKENSEIELKNGEISIQKHQELIEQSESSIPKEKKYLNLHEDFCEYIEDLQDMFEEKIPQINEGERVFSNLFKKQHFDKLKEELEYINIHLESLGETGITHQFADNELEYQFEVTNIQDPAIITQINYNYSQKIQAAEEYTKKHANIHSPQNLIEEDELLGREEDNSAFRHSRVDIRDAANRILNDASREFKSPIYLMNTIEEWTNLNPTELKESGIMLQITDIIELFLRICAFDLEPLGSTPDSFPMHKTSHISSIPWIKLIIHKLSGVLEILSEPDLGYVPSLPLFVSAIYTSKGFTLRVLDIIKYEWNIFSITSTQLLILFISNYIHHVFVKIEGSKVIIGVEEVKIVLGEVLKRIQGGVEQCRIIGNNSVFTTWQINRSLKLLHNIFQFKGVLPMSNICHFAIGLILEENILSYIQEYKNIPSNLITNLNKIFIKFYEKIDDKAIIFSNLENSMQLLKQIGEKIPNGEMKDEIDYLEQTLAQK